MDTATAAVREMLAGRYEECAARFSPELRAAVSGEVLATAWKAQTDQFGPAGGLGEASAEPAGPGLTRVQIPVRCADGEFTVVLGVAESGTIAGLRFAAAAAWSVPSYVDEKAFAERQVVLAGEPHPVPGTLTVPHGPGPWPGVVLLSGGGIFDRDETAGPNKPLKDLAWGLASRGVAVLRFDKVTHAHPELASAPGFTPSSEYVPHAVAAVQALRDEPAVAAGRVYLVGHSMGGKIAPRIAAAEPSVAGLVLLAADAEPMHLAAIRVVRHLATMNPQAEAMIEPIEQQAAAVADPDLSASAPGERLLFGYPGSYWLELRAYDPVATAAALDRPMLLVQGGRDYQVTAGTDLARWRDGLAGRPDISFSVRENADHLFFPGTGPVTPESYREPQHVDAEVIAEIAGWIRVRGR